MKKKVYGTHVTLPNGKRVYVSGRTKEERAEKVAKTRFEVGAGVDVSDDTTFRDYAYTWARVYKSPKLRTNSYTTLLANLENHVLPVLGDMRLRDIKPLHIQLFLTSISSLSRSTQSKCLQITSAVLQTAADNGLILKSPVTKNDQPGGGSAEEEEPLSDEQARALLKATEGTRAFLFCLLALSTGLRRGELLGLMWEDVDLEAGVILVTHNKVFPANANDAPVTTLLKTASARRRVPLPAVLRASLERERKASDSPYVLSMANGESLSKSSFRKLWAIVEARTAGDGRNLGSTVSGGKGGPIPISLDFRCHPHQLRHTYATKLFEAGMDIKQVQYLLGHSTPEMTLRVYTHYRERCRASETADQVCTAMDYLAV